jgi:hypothetical protein
MGYKIVKALQPLDLTNKNVKVGDQVELDEKEADELIARGLAEEGSIQGDADRRRPEDLTDETATDKARPLSTSSFPTSPDNKMQPGASNK